MAEEDHGLHLQILGMGYLWEIKVGNVQQASGCINVKQMGEVSNEITTTWVDILPKRLTEREERWLKGRTLDEKIKFKKSFMILE